MHSDDVMNDLQQQARILADKAREKAEFLDAEIAATRAQARELRQLANRLWPQGVKRERPKKHKASAGQGRTPAMRIVPTLARLKDGETFSQSEFAESLGMDVGQVSAAFAYLRGIEAIVKTGIIRTSGGKRRDAYEIRPGIGRERIAEMMDDAAS